MLDLDLIVDAYGLNHNISGIRNRWGHLILEIEDLELIKKAQGRDIEIRYPYQALTFDYTDTEFDTLTDAQLEEFKERARLGDKIADGGTAVYRGKKDPNFSFEKFLDWVAENEDEIRAKIKAKK